MHGAWKTKALTTKVSFFIHLGQYLTVITMHGVLRIFVRYSSGKGSNNPQVSCKCRSDLQKNVEDEKGASIA